MVRLDQVSFGFGLTSLADGIATNPVWDGVQEPMVVARGGHPARIGIFGAFTPEAGARVKALTTELPGAVRLLRHATYRTVEDDVVRLAGLLRSTLKPEDLERASFVPIPRGGMIVLGMLAYVLGLDAERLAGPPDPAGPLVIVDDCALSGAGFRRFLQQQRHERVVFAHLYSHPALRAAIHAEESRVAAVISAADLVDHGPAVFGDGYQAWQQRWLERTDGDGYWSGYLDHITFPWTEPGWAVVDPSGGAVLSGWHILPPELCLKHRVPVGSPVADVQIQAEGPGPIRASPEVVVADRDHRLLVAGAGGIVALEGVAADMWRSVIGAGSVAGAITSLASSYDISETDLTADLRGFVEDLFGRGLLVEDPPTDHNTL